MAVDLTKYGITDVTVPIKIGADVLQKMTEDELKELTSVAHWPDGLASSSLAAAKAALKEKQNAAAFKEMQAGKGRGTKKVKLASKKGETGAFKDDEGNKKKDKTYGQMGEAKKDKDDQEKMLSKERGKQATALKKNATLVDKSAYKKTATAVGKYGGVQANVEALTAKVKAGGKMMIGPNMVTVTGDLAAEAILAGGKLNAITKPVEFSLLDEQVGFQAGAEANAKVGAWAKASGAIDVRTTKAEAGLEAKAEAFAGAKAGGKIFMGVHWNKKAPNAYYEPAWAFVQQKAASKGGILKKVIDFIDGKSALRDKALGMILGKGGRTNLLRLVAGGEVSAGIGGTAYAACKIGRSFKFTGELKGTLGVGVGGSVSAEIGVVDAAVLGLILAVRAFPKVQKIWAQLKQAIGERLNRMKIAAKMWVNKKKDDVAEMSWWNPAKHAASGSLAVASWVLGQIDGINFANYL